MSRCKPWSLQFRPASFCCRLWWHRSSGSCGEGSFTRVSGHRRGKSGLPRWARSSSDGSSLPARTTVDSLERLLVSGAAIAIMADVHDLGRPPCRLVACVTVCLIPVLANATQTDAQAPSDPQAYCVNGSADFYPYTGNPCKSGYQLGSGNCRNTDGRMVTVPREQCVAMAGTVELPFEHGIAPPPFPRWRYLAPR
jgi:hypothetical protein